MTGQPSQYKRVGGKQGKKYNNNVKIIQITLNHYYHHYCNNNAGEQETGNHYMAKGKKWRKKTQMEGTCTSFSSS